MRVFMINTSPHEKGCTNRALEEIASALTDQGVESEILWIGDGAHHGCTACRYCYEHGVCVHDEDLVNTAVQKALDSDALVLGSPVHYASACGAGSSFLDRLFRVAATRLAHKPGASIVSCRRGGASAAFDRLNKYLTFAQMPVVSSTYWNSVHGHTPEEVEQDLEGLQVMRNLGRNMAWLLKCIEAGKKQGIDAPEAERTYTTNYIR